MAQGGATSTREDTHAQTLRGLGLPLALPLALTAATSSASYADSSNAHITLTRWTDNHDFRTGTSNGVRVQGDRLVLDRHGPLLMLDYIDPFGDGTPRPYDYGTWTSPVIQVGYPDDESISSWNARRRPGRGWRRVPRRHTDGTWTKWYVMGRWTSGMDYAAGDIHRTSVNGQGDTDGTVLTDTFAEERREPVGSRPR